MPHSIALLLVLHTEANNSSGDSRNESLHSIAIAEARCEEEALQGTRQARQTPVAYSKKKS